MDNPPELSQRLADGQTEDHTEPKPVFFNLSQEADREQLSHLLDQNPATKVIDTYDGQLKEVFVLENPWLHLNKPQRDQEFVSYRADHYAGRPEWQAGVWVYLSWRHVLLHVLDDANYQKVRTARNRNLITAAEQETFYNSTIGIAGQSVGNSCALTIVQTGGGKRLRLADNDTLELTNLNRIRGSIAEITSLKVHMSARQIYELDPYADLELFTDGLTEANIEKFFDGPPKLDVVVDEIDQLGMKIRIRQEAKKRGIPVVMAADNGDSGVLDIERHDLEDDIELFHGRAGSDLADRVLKQDPPLPIIGRIIGEELIGFDIHEERMLESLLEIGKSIPTWPQLGSAAALNGVLVATAVRKIITGQPLENNRAVASMSELLVPGYNEPDHKAKRQQLIDTFVQKSDEALEQLKKKLG